MLICWCFGTLKIMTWLLTITALQKNTHLSVAPGLAGTRAAFEDLDAHVVEGWRVIFGIRSGFDRDEHILRGNIYRINPNHTSESISQLISLPFTCWFEHIACRWKSDAFTQTSFLHPVSAGPTPMDCTPWSTCPPTKTWGKGRRFTNVATGTGEILNPRFPHLWQSIGPGLKAWR